MSYLPKTTFEVSKDNLEGGTAIVRASFKDADGSDLTPNTLTYTLCDQYGHVVNDKQDVSVSPNSSISITLSGADVLAGKVYVVLKGRFDSIYGSNLSLRDYTTVTAKRLPGD